MHGAVSPTDARSHTGSTAVTVPDDEACTGRLRPVPRVSGLTFSGHGRGADQHIAFVPDMLLLERNNQFFRYGHTRIGVRLDCNFISGG